jgi:hypothetical protein
VNELYRCDLCGQSFPVDEVKAHACTLSSNPQASLLFRMRELVTQGRGSPISEYRDCLRLAADEIERLTRERDEARAIMRIERHLADQVDRLRTALDELQEIIGPHGDFVIDGKLRGFIKNDCYCGYCCVQRKAREALRGAVETTAVRADMDQPWPLHDVLAKLCDATEHLLDVHDCDGHGHEEYRTAAKRGRELCDKRTGRT